MQAIEAFRLKKYEGMLIVFQVFLIEKRFKRDVRWDAKNRILRLNGYMPTIDLKLGAKRIHKNEQSAKEMLHFLLKNIDNDVMQMTAAYSEKNWEALRAGLHKILGGLSYCGAPDLEQACLQLQSSVKNRDFGKLESLFKKFMQEVSILKRVAH